MMDELMDDYMLKYMETHLPLEEYYEYIIYHSKYTIRDIVTVHYRLGDGSVCTMVVCPKYCVIEGHGIIPCDFFKGVKQVFDEHHMFKGWEIIDEIPPEIRIDIGRL